MGSLNISTSGIRFVLLQIIFLACLSNVLVLGYALYFVVYYYSLSFLMFQARKLWLWRLGYSLSKHHCLDLNPNFLTVNPKLFPPLLRCIIYCYVTNYFKT